MIIRALLLWLALTVGAFAQPVLDNPSVTSAHQAGGTSATIALTTAANNETAILFIFPETAGTTFTTSVSGGGLTWTKRVSVINTNNGFSGHASYSLAEEWYAAVPTSGTKTITVTTTATMDAIAMGIAAFTNVASQVWDSDASIPAQQVLGTNTAQSRTINTTQGHDAVFGFSATSSNNGSYIVMGGATFSLLVNATETTGASNYARYEVEWNTYTTHQSSLTVTMGDTGASAGNNATFIVDAITSDKVSTGAPAGFFQVSP